MTDVYHPETAIFAAGCFWGVQFYFDQVPGVLETEVGYIGGTLEHPSYEAVVYTDTGHAEAVKVTFNPQLVSYGNLLKHFFRLHDPTQLNRQGPDIGSQYRSAIFYMDDSQQRQAEKYIAKLNTRGQIKTKLEKAGTFWPAEAYHQKFTERTGVGMCHVPYAPV